MLKFLKSGSNFKVKRSQGQKFWYQKKGLVIKNTHVKYESSITYHSKDMANVKVFADRQTDRQTDKQTNRRTGQKLYAPDLSIRGIKKKLHKFAGVKSK